MAKAFGRRLGQEHDHGTSAEGGVDLTPSTLDLAGGGEVEGLVIQAIEHSKVLADDGILYDSVQTAENNATDWMFIGPGTFQENVTIDTGGLYVRGSGRGTLIDGTDGVGVLIDGVDNVVLDRFSVRNNTDALNFPITTLNNPDRCRYNGLWVREAGLTAINLSGNNMKVVTGCVIENADSLGISTTDEAIIKSNIVRNVGTTGIHVAGGGQAIGNFITDNGSGDAGIDMSGGELDIAIGNRILNSGGRGIQANGGRQLAIGNMIKNPSGDGIELNNTNCLAAMNIIQGSGDVGLEVLQGNCVVFGNRITGSTTQDRDFSSATNLLANGVMITSSDLGGTDGSISMADRGLARYSLRLDAGGSATNLQGIDGPTIEGVVVMIIHTGGENVVLEDSNGSASNPLSNPGQQNITLSANDQWVKYMYDDTEWVMVARDPDLASIRNKGTESGVIDTNTASVQSVSVSHGLDVTPAAEDIQAVPSNGPNNGESMSVVQVRSIGSSSFTVDVEVTSTSGGSGESADLSWSVNAGEPT